MCGGKVNSASIPSASNLDVSYGHDTVMISLISVHGQSEPRIYVNTHHKASAEGLEMTWNGLQGSDLHSFTKGHASEKLMSRRVRSSDAKEKICGTVGSVFTELSVWLIPGTKLQQVFCGFLPVPRRTASTALPRRMATPGGHWPRPATAKTRYQAEAGQDIY